MNLGAVNGLPTRPVAAVWYRAVDPKYLPTALNYSHTRLFASRYYERPQSSQQFDLVYLAENQLVALLEVEGLFGSPAIPGGLVPNPSRSWLTINAQVQLSAVADLTDVSGSHVPLSTTAQELTGDWKGYTQRNATTGVSTPVGTAPTQELGAALFHSGVFEGFVTISAKMPYQRVLGVFPGRVSRGNYVRYTYVDPAGRMQVQQIP